MPRSLVLVVAWLLAAAVSLTVAWRGVAVVGDQVTDDDRPAPLTAAELGADTPQGDVSSTTTAPPGSASTSTTTPEEAAAVTESYDVVGGSATLRFSPTGVELVVATPHAGFQVDTEPEHGNGIRVEFESDTHRSRVDGWWDGGPQVRTREEPDR